MTASSKTGRGIVIIGGIQLGFFEGGDLHGSLLRIDDPKLLCTGRHSYEARCRLSLVGVFEGDSTSTIRGGA